MRSSQIAVWTGAMGQSPLPPIDISELQRARASLALAAGLAGLLAWVLAACATLYFLVNRPDWGAAAYLAGAGSCALLRHHIVRGSGAAVIALGVLVGTAMLAAGGAIVVSFVETGVHEGGWALLPLVALSFLALTCVLVGVCRTALTSQAVLERYYGSRYLPRLPRLTRRTPFAPYRLSGWVLLYSLACAGCAGIVWTCVEALLNWDRLLSNGVPPWLIPTLSLLGVTLAAGAYFLLPALTGFLLRTAKRQAAPTANEARRQDRRSPVLLIRSFQDDHQSLAARESPRSALQRDLRPRSGLTFEEAITAALWVLGPVIAIGRPGERLPPLGAAREYVSNDTWQARVEEHVRQASRVVAILGVSGGLAWEYARVHELAALRKLIVIFPPRPAADLRERWDAFCASTNPALGSLLSATPVTGWPLLVRFTESGLPQLITGYVRNAQAYQVALSLCQRSREERCAQLRPGQLKIVE